MASELHADGLAPPEGLGDVALAAVGIHPGAETLQGVVPDEILLLPSQEAVDSSLGQSGHDSISECIRKLSSPTSRVLQSS